MNGWPCGTCMAFETSKTEILNNKKIWNSFKTTAWWKGRRMSKFNQSYILAKISEVIIHNRLTVVTVWYLIFSLKNLVDVCHIQQKIYGLDIHHEHKKNKFIVH